MPRKLLIGALLALAFAAPAAAQTTLMPGVTYERGVQFTPHGPVAIHIVRGPRPTGLYALRPVLSNETIQGLERVTAMQKRLSATATMVGVNGDFFAASGRPSGVLMRDGVVDSPPFGDRSSVGVTPEGALDVRRVEFFGTWRGLGQRRALNDLNQVPGPERRLALHPELRPGDAGAVRRHRGRHRPVPAGDAEHRPVRPGGPGRRRRRHADPAGRRRARRARHRRGSGSPRRRRSGPTLALRIIFRPEWTGITDAVGGGPVLVRNGGPVFRANEAFTSSQLAPRNPRTGVGQLADGRDAARRHRRPPAGLQRRA